MSRSGQLEITEIKKTSEIDLAFPSGLSFFEPYLQYHVKEILEIGGEAYVARTPAGAITGLFIYDSFEKAGTIYTKSRDIFDYFYGLKPFDSLFAELKTEHENEIYDIYTLDLKNVDIDHRFTHEIKIAGEEHTDEIERLMVSTYPGINRRWVKVAMKNRDMCFFVRLENEIAGWGWLSFVNGIGRFHTLYIKPQYRRMGMAEDLFHARLLWLKSKQASSVFSEISRHNIPCSSLETKGHFIVSGQIYQYFKKDPGKKMGAEKLADVPRL